MNHKNTPPNGPIVRNVIMRSDGLANSANPVPPIGSRPSPVIGSPCPISGNPTTSPSGRKGGK